MKIKLIALLVIVTMLTSCIEIIEKVHFNKDGSGEVTYKIDASQMMDAMKTMLPDSMKEDMDISAIQDKMDSVLLALKNVNGISDVNGNATLSVISYEFKFKNLDVLQQAYSIFNKNLENKNQIFWEQKGKSIIRNNFLGGDSYSQMFEDSTMDIASIESYFEDAKLIQEFTFDKDIKSVTGNAVIDKSKHKVTNTVPFLELIKSKEKKPFEIVLK